MIDRALVIRKINLILKDLKAIEPFGRMSIDAYLGDPVNEPAAERYLERIIGRMIDVNYHIVTELGDPPPRDYYESFIALARRQVLPTDFAHVIAQSAGLRNRIPMSMTRLMSARSSRPSGPRCGTFPSTSITSTGF